VQASSGLGAEREWTGRSGCVSRPLRPVEPRRRLFGAFEVYLVLEEKLKRAIRCSIADLADAVELARLARRVVCSERGQDCRHELKIAPLGSGLSTRSTISIAVKDVQELPHALLFLGVYALF
jgi:hypothetical protein